MEGMEPRACSPKPPLPGHLPSARLCLLGLIALPLTEASHSPSGRSGPLPALPLYLGWNLESALLERAEPFLLSATCTLITKEMGRGGPHRHTTSLKCAEEVMEAWGPAQVHLETWRWGGALPVTTQAGLPKVQGVSVQH